MPTLVKIEGFRVIEIPVAHHPRQLAYRNTQPGTGCGAPLPTS